MAIDQHIAVDDFVASALVTQISIREAMARRAARSTHEDFLQALDQAADVEPAEHDHLPRS